MASLHQLTIHELSHGLRNRQFTAQDILKDLFAAIDANDSQLGAYLNLDREDAFDQARAADEARAAGKDLPLLGIPVAIKDVINVNGQPCTCGSHILEGYKAPYDATAIAGLRKAGAIICGRTNCDEFAMGSSNENSAFKKTANPWNTACVPGGSSGGSASAIAANIAIAALGSDTGGSVRQPASFCGCVGLKPSYGRVSRYGLTAYASSLDQIGPICKDVHDAALILNAIAGHDKCDSTSVAAPVPDYTESLKTDLRGLKIGIPREYFIEGCDPEVIAAVREAIAQCQKLGATVTNVSLPYTRYAIATYYIVATAEASTNLARFDGVRYGARRTPEGSDPIAMYCATRAAGFGSEVKRRIILGTYVLSSGYYDAYYLRGQKVRALIQDDFRRAFEQCDVLLTPVAPTTAFKFGEKTNNPLQMYLSDIFTVTANLAGICGISVPCGFSKQKLPIGLQILGPAFKEENIIRTAYAYEQSTEWHKQKPAIGG